MWLLSWRIPLLIAFYVAFFLHVALFHAWGIQTVGHLGFGEFFGTLSSGLVTAGAIFSLVVFVHALFFGGWFCGWFCHWGILQDLAMAIYRRLGLRPRLVRVSSPWVPWCWFLVILGQVGFTWYHSGFPVEWSLALGITPVWSGVPRSIFLVCLTTIASGFLLILLFGDRAFCRTICTFRLWFAWFERFAPHKIYRKSDCVSCQADCTSSCSMGVQVAAEVNTWGMVRDTACSKCGDCLTACPGGVLGTGFWPSPRLPLSPPAAPPAPPDLDARSMVFPSLVSILALILFCPSLGGNISMSLGLVAGFMGWRLQAQRRLSRFEILVTPILILALVYRIDLDDPVSLGKGLLAIVVFLALARMVRYEEAGPFLADEARKAAMPAWATGLVALAVLGFGAREAVSSFYVHQLRAARQIQDTGALSCALENVSRVLPDRGGPLRELGLLHWREGRLASAEEVLHRSLEEDLHPAGVSALYQILNGQGRAGPALALLERGLASFPEDVPLLRFRGEEFLRAGNLEGVSSTCLQLLTIDPEDAQAHLNLGSVLVMQSRLDEAENEFLQVHRKEPSVAARYLARLYSRMGRIREAESFFTQALLYSPKDPTLHFDQGITFASQDRLEEAIAAWMEVLRIDPACQEAIENIAAARARLESKGPTPVSRPTGGAVSPPVDAAPVPSSPTLPPASATSPTGSP